MGVSIRLPECKSPRKRRLSRKFLNAVLLAVVLLFWFLGGVRWADSDSGVEIRATEPAVESDLGDVMVGVNNLVIVTCHAIWLGGPTAGDNEAEWCATPPFPGTRIDLDCRAIEPFQKGETATFIQHIERGVELALRDPESLLVFSGCVPPPPPPQTT